MSGEREAKTIDKTVLVGICFRLETFGDTGGTRRDERLHLLGDGVLPLLDFLIECHEAVGVFGNVVALDFGHGIEVYEAGGRSSGEFFGTATGGIVAANLGADFGHALVVSHIRSSIRG